MTRELRSCSAPRTQPLGAGREAVVLMILGHAAETTSGDSRPLEATECSEREREMWEIDDERRDRGKIFKRK